ncbi:hypothetical protein CR513_16046, partial [Mucuna pruriens]
MSLPPRSVQTFDESAGLFLSQFAANKTKRLEVADLFGIRQTRGESLKSYLARFNDATIRVDDPDQKFFVKAFKKGLRVGPFSDALAFHRPTSMEEIRARAEEHVEMEEGRFEKREEPIHSNGLPKHLREALAPVSGQAHHSNRQIQSKGYEVSPQFTPLKEKKARIMIMGKNRQEWCDFHRANGHSTEDCWTLGAQLESLIQQGRLGQYVARAGREKTRSGGEPSARGAERIRGWGDHSRSPWPAPTFYRGTISTISG